EKNDEIRYGTIPNPTVHIALNQIRQVVNELIRRYGKPDQIVIELARDLPAGAEGRLETIRFQSENQRTNDRIREELVALGEEDNRANRQKFQLWEDLAKDPTDRRCLFTGQMIGKHQLYSGEIEIEHLLPYSRTWDDSMANKTVCFTRANRYKGNQSPFEAFGHSPGEYNWADILGRITTLKKSKQWRFREDAMTRFEEEAKFHPRHIVSTQYISRYTRKYLSSVVDQNNVYVVTGKLTAMLRGHWGLNSVLRGDNVPEDAKGKKLRDDLRPHAIDAIVIAMTSRSILQRVATAAGKGETQFLEKLFVDKRDIDPWPGFRMDVMEQMDKLVVSHRVRHKNQGQLHNDTAYGFVTGKPGKAVHRIPVESFVNDKKLDLIRDDYIRKQLKDVTYGLSGQEFKEAVLNWCSKQYCEIKSLRISVEGFVDDKKLDLICDDNIRVQLKDVTDGLLGQDFKEAILNWCSKQYPVIKSLRIPVEGIENAEILDLICDDNIRGQLKVVTYGLSGPEFKEAVLNWCSKQYYTIKSLRVIESISLIAIKDKNGAPYKGYKPDGNAYMDIFPDDKGKWQGEVVRRFDASNPKFIPEWRQARPAQKRIMQLRIDDILKIEEQGNATFLRVQRLSKGIVVLAPLNEANVDARNRNPEDDFMFTYKSPSALQKLKAVKVHISPTGLIREAR
ncbi:MAG: type II CRISPR RNA-guided endonuclease Cas9, partial [Alphaproteobacteria bacterium]|nr:type II CRISPR RNA-guided endonuclease Cas9 [Alphaproteobacteria bacterium]